MSKTLKKVLKKLVITEAHEQLAVADAKLGQCIKVWQGQFFQPMYYVKHVLD